MASEQDKAQWRLDGHKAGLAGEPRQPTVVLQRRAGDHLAGRMGRGRDGKGQSRCCCF